MHNPEYVLKNEMEKLLYDFEIQTDHLISAGRPVLTMINIEKRTSRILYFTILADPKVSKMERKRKEK